MSNQPNVTISTNEDLMWVLITLSSKRKPELGETIFLVSPKVFNLCSNELCIKNSIGAINNIEKMINWFEAYSHTIPKQEFEYNFLIVE